MPISGRPNAKKNSNTVNGQLRMTVTQAVPNHRSEAIGETRKDATTVPSTREPTIPHRQIPRDRRNPDQNRSRFSVTPSTATLLDGGGEPAATPVDAAAGRWSVQLQGAAGGRVGSWVPSILPAVSAHALL